MGVAVTAPVGTLFGETSHHALPELCCHTWPWLPAACRLVQHYQSLQCSLTCFCQPFSGVCDCSCWPCLKRKYLYLPPVGPVCVIHGLPPKLQRKVKVNNPISLQSLAAGRTEKDILAVLIFILTMFVSMFHDHLGLLWYKHPLVLVLNAFSAARSCRKTRWLRT